MAIHTAAPPLAAPLQPIPLHRRLWGLGSVYGKSVRDGRIGWLIVTGLLVLFFLAGGWAMASEYGTAETRLELARMSASLPPAMRGIYGNPVNVATLGGFVTWHYGGYTALILGLWSILVLSGTLAGETRRGSLDLVATTPVSRARIALEKVAGHLTLLAAAMVVVALSAWSSGVVFATFPGDEVAPAAAVGFAMGLGLKGLIAGSVAFALAPFLGRGAAAGVAGVVMLGGYLLAAYRAVVPAFDVLARLSWFGWTADHLPLAGRTDVAPLSVVAGASAVLLVIGLLAFVRRDISTTGTARLPALPSAVVGIGGPVRRAFGEALPASIAWGVGLGSFGLLMAAASRAFADEVRQIPNMLQAIGRWFPGVDLTAPVSFLELLFVDFGLVLVGLAAATLVAGRMDDESAGRFECLLATPLTRARWVVASALGVWLGLAVIVAFLVAAIGLGVTAAGGDVGVPVAGTLVLGIYAAALAGVGFAVGGIVGPSLAGPVTAALAIGTSLVDLLGPGLALPQWLQDLALTNHVGEPMLGTWDPGGMAVCALLAAGGVLAGAWGLRRRDVRA